MQRRQLLAVLAAGGGVGLSGCQDVLSGDEAEPTESPPPTTGPATPQPTETPPETETEIETEEPEFGTVVNMVEDRDVDPTGGEPIDDALADAAADDTLLEFPPGEYLVTDSLLLRRADTFGIRGTGEHHREVRFTHPEGYSGLLVDVRDGRNCLFENFTADQTDDETTNSGLIVRQQTGLIVKDLEVAGFTPLENKSPDASGSIDLVTQVLDPKGVGTVVRFTSVGGSQVGVYPNSYPGLYAGGDSRGTLRLVDCHVEDCGGAGVYTSRARGPVKISGGLFRNNEVAQVRVSGKGSFVRNARIVVDTDQRRNSRGNYETVRGLWWESGDRGKTGGVAYDCEFVANSAPVRRGLLEVDGTAGGMTVQDCRFETNREQYFAIFAFPPGSSTMGGYPDRPWGIAVKDVTVTGSAGGRDAIRIDSRPGSRLSGVDLDQPSADRGGLAIKRSPGSRIADSRIVVGGFPVRLSLAGEPADDSCRLELGDGTDVRSTGWAGVPGDPVELNGDGDCLPKFDVDDGSLVVVDRCDQGFVGGIIQGNPDGSTTAHDCK
jgi:hypothetical protein